MNPEQLLLKHRIKINRKSKDGTSKTGFRFFLLAGDGQGMADINARPPDEAGVDKAERTKRTGRKRERDKMAFLKERRWPKKKKR